MAAKYSSTTVFGPGTAGDEAGGGTGAPVWPREVSASAAAPTTARTTTTAAALPSHRRRGRAGPGCHGNGAVVSAGRLPSATFAGGTSMAGARADGASATEACADAASMGNAGADAAPASGACAGGVSPADACASEGRVSGTGAGGTVGSTTVL